MENKLTRRHEHINGETISYVINSGLSPGLCLEIVDLQRKIIKNFPSAVWPVPDESLHITLMDWLAPFTDYSGNPDNLYLKIKDEYTIALKSVLQNKNKLSIHFDEIRVSSTTIYIQASLDRELNQIRSDFLEKVALLPGTKPPANITHISIARFAGEYDLKPITDYLSRLSIEYKELISEWRLVRETKLPMLEYKVIEKFQLK